MLWLAHLVWRLECSSERACWRAEGSQATAISTSRCKRHVHSQKESDHCQMLRMCRSFALLCSELEYELQVACVLKKSTGTTIAVVLLEAE